MMNLVRVPLEPCEEKMLAVLEESGVGLRAGIDLLLRFHVAVFGESGDTPRAMTAAPTVDVDHIEDTEARTDEREAAPMTTRVLEIPRTKRCAECGEVKGKTAFSHGQERCRKCASQRRPHDAGLVLRAREDTSPALRKCLYCDERKPAKEFGKGQCCKACEAKD